MIGRETMMKRIYETPVVEIFSLECLDIITTSERDEILPEFPLEDDWE